MKCQVPLESFASEHRPQGALEPRRDSVVRQENNTLAVLSKSRYLGNDYHGHGLLDADISSVSGLMCQAAAG